MKKRDRVSGGEPGSGGFVNGASEL